MTLVYALGIPILTSIIYPAPKHLLESHKFALNRNMNHCYLRSVLLVPSLVVKAT